MVKKDEPNKAFKIMAPNTDIADVKAESPDEIAHQQLLENPKYAVVVHDKQIGRIVDALENVAIKLSELENRLNELETQTRFPKFTHDGPPESPSGIKYGS